MKGDSMTKTATVDALSVSGAYPAVDELDGTLVFRLGYDGAAFSGFAEQPEGLRTVAGARDVLAPTCRLDVRWSHGCRCSRRIAACEHSRACR